MRSHRSIGDPHPDLEPAICQIAVPNGGRMALMIPETIVPPGNCDQSQHRGDNRRAEPGWIEGLGRAFGVGVVVSVGASYPLYLLAS
jgi:hypothetical protein